MSTGAYGGVHVHGSRRTEVERFDFNFGKSKLDAYACTQELESLTGVRSVAVATTSVEWRESAPHWGSSWHGQVEWQQNLVLKFVDGYCSGGSSLIVTSSYCWCIEPVDGETDDGHSRESPMQKLRDHLRSLPKEDHEGLNCHADDGADDGDDEHGANLDEFNGMQSVTCYFHYNQSCCASLTRL